MTLGQRYRLNRRIKALKATLRATGYALALLGALYVLQLTMYALCATSPTCYALNIK